MRVAFLNSHPIQYHSHWFRALSTHPELDVEVLYCWKPDAAAQGRSGFGVAFEWDVPLFDGYKYRFLKNIAKTPSTDSFSGLDTPEIRSLIKSGAYDAVVTNGWHYKSGWQAMRACWSADVPVLVRSDSHLHTQRSAFARMAKEIPYRWFISRLDGCLPVGRWSAEYFLHYGASPGRVHIVPHVASGVFTHASSQRTERRALLRRQWGVEPDDVVFVFVGKQAEVKRPLDFVAALGAASKTTRHIAGVIVGDGPLRADCETLGKQSAAPLKFVGFMNQSKVVDVYLAGDVLVLPGAETWGLVVNEAMSCGMPAIVSDRVGCGPDLVEHGATGWIFPYGDVDALTGLLVACVRERASLDTIRSAAAQRVQSRSTDVGVTSMVTALQSTIGRV